MIEQPFWKSTEFWSALVGMVVIALSSVIPELRSQLDIIAPALVTIIVSVLVKGTVVQTQALRVQAEQYKARAAGANWVNPPTKGEMLDGRP